MKRIGSSIYQLLLFVLALTSFVVLLTTFPVKASALETISTQTMQVLPVGGNACAPVSATNFTSYIYDGALHSFEFTLPDPSYVALIGSAGNTPISFQTMTRRTDTITGSLRVHVDIPTTPILGMLPIRVTLLSARTGSPVCLMVVSMSISGSASIQPPPVGILPIPQPSPAPTPVAPSPAPSPIPAPQPSPTPSTSTSQTPTSTATGSVVSMVRNPLQNICASDAGAYRLWLILLVLYMLIVGAALWAEFPMALSWARTPERIATIILGFLLLLLPFWYFSIPCRAALWMPLVAFLVAVLGLLAAFWNHPRVTQMLLIQQTPTPPTTPTPPARKM